MSTSEYRSVDAESDLPISGAELAALASQLYAASIRPGPDSPPRPRRSPRAAACPTRRRPRRPGRRPPALRSVPESGSLPRCHRTSMSRRRRHPEPEGVPPQTVPVAPRGSAPDTRRAVGRLRSRRGRPCLPPGLADLTAFAVPARASCRPCPVCWPGRTDRAGGAARLGAGLVAAEAPPVPDLGWSGAPPAAPAGDEASYYFLTQADPVPR